MKGIHLPGDRVSLHPVSISDAEILLKFYNEAKHYLGAAESPPMTLTQEQKFIEKLNNESNGGNYRDHVYL